ncbi:hypothetical protein BGY98DRAFT_276722 [Russula aff. rugulosa BPL654]|nr:hypothetical protein BGY98DRAFT_276722 [Russula aff. rugulosa BPL654]
MPLLPSTIRLSKYNNQSRHSCPFRPNHDLDRSGWRSSRVARPASLPFSLPLQYIYIYIYILIEIPVPFSLHTTDFIPPFRFVARETGSTKIPLPSLPVVHGPYLRVCRIVSIMRFGVKLNLSLSLPRGSRIGYDAMICTMTMRRHALLLIALAHSTHLLGPRCGAIAMMLFFFKKIPPLSFSWH